MQEGAAALLPELSAEQFQCSVLTVQCSLFAVRCSVFGVRRGKSQRSLGRAKIRITNERMTTSDDDYDDEL